MSKAIRRGRGVHHTFSGFAIPLPQDHRRYFLVQEADLTVPLFRLVSPRRNEHHGNNIHRAIHNAALKMERAYRRRLNRRPPPRVKRISGCRYLLLDGNATYGAAKHSGWTSLPVCLFPNSRHN